MARTGKEYPPTAVRIQTVTAHGIVPYMFHFNMPRLMWVGYAALFVLTIFFSTYALTESPGVWYDEGYYLQLAMNQAHHGKLELQVAPGEFVSAGFVSVGFPLIYPIAFVFDHFGVGVLQARAVMAAFIMLLMGTSLFLIWRLFGHRVALLSGTLLATFPLVYGNGKSVLGEVPGLVFLMLFLICVAYLERTDFKQLRWYILAGLFGGLCVTTKPVFLLLGPAVVITALIYRRNIRWQWFFIGVGLLSFLAPFLWWLISQFSGNSLSQIFSYYTNPYEVSNILKLVFVNALRFIRETTPLYCFIFTLCWSSFITIRILRREHIRLAETTAFLFSLLVLLAYLRTPGWYRYFFIAQVFTLLFFSPAVLFITEKISSYLPKLLMNLAVPVCFTALLILAGLQLYQLNYDSFVASYYKSTASHELIEYFKQVDPGKSFFLYNVPEIAIFLPNNEYYQYLHPQNSIILGEGEFSVIESGKADFVVLRAGEYPQNNVAFNLYTLRDTVSNYIVLERKL